MDLQEKASTTVTVRSITSSPSSFNSPLSHSPTMLFTRIASMLAVLTFGLVALANPVEKRQTTTPITSTALVTALQTKVNGLTSQLQSVSSASASNTVLAQSIVTQLISAFEEANNQAASGSLTKRQTDTDVADILADSITITAISLDPVVVLIPALVPLIVELDVTINGLVLSLDVDVSGLILTLNALLVGVAAIVGGVGFTILLATVGL